MPREIVANSFLTLDGVMQAPGGPEEDPAGGFRHGGWSAGYWDEAMGDLMGELTSRSFDLVLGRRTYEIFAGSWGQMADPGDDPVAVQLNTLPKYVPSTTLTDPTWANTTVLSGDVAEQVRELKARPGRELQVHGSGTLVRWLLANDLVDELNLLIFPVIVGDGTRLFADKGLDTALELAESRTTPKGVTVQVYRNAGRPEYGTVEVE